MRQRIGVNGGTFDPIHFGHLRPALEALEACALDAVHFIPCCRPVHRSAPRSAPRHRLEMIRLAIEQVPEFVLDDREIQRQGPSYMVDTLYSLKRERPDAALALILGSDAFAKFDRWHRWRDILRLASLVVTQRPDAPSACPEALQPFLYDGPLAQLPETGGVGFLPATQLAISSTLVRRRLQAGLRVDYLMPRSVIEYIQREKLYRQVSSTEEG